MNITKKSRLSINWKVNPFDFSKERLNSLRSKIAKKYNVPREHIQIIPDFLMINEKGEELSITNDIIANIQNPEFQIKLFNEYLLNNDIKDYDFDLIRKIDAEINAKIDYDVYDKYRHYSINWIKWSNFLSYGEDNFFDFRQLSGLVLLNGEPANQSGKTTFAIDLLHFLLFGKTDKSATLDRIFNKHLSEATEVVIEGSLMIDDQEFLIKRTLSRPSLSKRSDKSKTTQKVDYYKVYNDTVEELVDEVDNQQGESSVQTNKVIKEAIGKESDFDLIICATSNNLDALIEKKDTERGKLMSKWIGLLPLEEKDIIAREKFNTDIKPSLLSTKYNVETLKQEIKAYSINIETKERENIKYHEENKQIDKDIALLEDTKTTLISSKKLIDSALLKVDRTTLEKQLKTIIDDGKNKKLQLKDIVDELTTLENISFSVSKYDLLVEEKNKLNIEISIIGEKFTHIKTNIESLKNSEFCHACGRKYENIDNSIKLKEMEESMTSLSEEGKKIRLLINEKESLIENMKIHREQYERKTVLMVKQSTIELKIEQCVSAYRDKEAIMKEYNLNNEAIDNNNDLDIKIRNTEMFLKDKRNTKDTNNRFINNNENDIKTYGKSIDDREEVIKKIINESILLRHWKIYLDMIGKNGICKMVLRKTLPIINAQLSHLLIDVCDFTIDISINDKNDIIFSLVKDDIKSDLISGSGFEKTASALALRTVLGNISTMPKLNFLCCDEILGRVAKENYDNMKTLFTKILTHYDFIIQISHLEEIKDWHDKIITVIKENNVSRLKLNN